MMVAGSAAASAEALVVGLAEASVAGWAVLSVEVMGNSMIWLLQVN